MIKTNLKLILLLFILGFNLPNLLFSQEIQSPSDSIGYENNDNLGGPKSVGRQLEVNNNKVLFKHRFEGQTLKKLYDWKARLNEKHGLKLGIYYTSVYLHSSQTISSDNINYAASGILDLQAGWTLIGHKTQKNTGTFYIKINSRHLYTGANSTSPMFHGVSESGYYGLPAAAFRKYSIRINELNWQQNLFNNRAGFVVGKVDMTNYFNFHGLVIPWQHFIGYGSSLSGTVNWGNQGLGAVVMGRPTEKLYVMAGIVDVYGDRYKDGQFLDFGSYFMDGKFMYMGEIGFVPNYAERYYKKISVTAWYSDSYTNFSDNFVGSGQGIAISSHWFIQQKYAPYIRFGISNGVGENTFYKTDIQIGHAILFRTYDMLGTSVSWNKPNIGGEDQYTAEVFYRFTLSSHLEITPSTQLIINPALIPDKSSLFYFGIRGRATF